MFFISAKKAQDVCGGEVTPPLREENYFIWFASVELL